MLLTLLMACRCLSEMSCTACSADLSAYIDWTLLYNVASNYLLPQAFVNETFAFFGQELNGESEIEPLDGR